MESTVKKDRFAGLKTIVDYIGHFFGPILGLLSASGMIKGVLALLSLYNIISIDSSFYMLLEAAGDAIFHFFPIVLGFSVADKMEMDPYLGAIIGAALMYPSLQNMEDISFLGVNIGNVSYANTVLPIVLVVVLATPLNKKLTQVLPDALKSFVAPMITLLVVIPLGFSLIGPAANYLADLVTMGITNLYSVSPIISSVVFASLSPVLIMSGLHFGLIVIIYADLIAGIPSPLMPIILTTSIVQSAVVGVIWFKTKDKDTKSVALPATISGIIGITEPGLYGITLPNPKYLITTCIGCAVTGFMVGLNSVVSYFPAGVGVFGIVGMINEAGLGNAFYFVLAIILGMLVAGALTFVVYKDDVTVAVDVEED